MTPEPMVTGATPSEKRRTRSPCSVPGAWFRPNVVCCLTNRSTRSALPAITLSGSSQSPPQVEGTIPACIVNLDVLASVYTHVLGSCVRTIPVRIPLHACWLLCSKPASQASMRATRPDDITRACTCICLQTSSLSPSRTTTPPFYVMASQH
jgi:hypothetical protein